MVIGSFKYLSRSRESWLVVQILRVNASAATAPRQWILDIFMPQPPLTVIGSFKYLSRSRESWRVVQFLRVNAKGRANGY